jgi:copper chaperone CopZ
VITSLRIAGMTCNNCVRHVDQALRAVRGVSAVEVDLAGGSAKVTHDDGVPLASLLSAVESTGYDASHAP